MAKAKVSMRGPSEVADAIDKALADDTGPSAVQVKSINVRMTVPLHKAIAQLALDEDTKINRLVVEALHSLLKSRNRSVP